MESDLPNGANIRYIFLRTLSVNVDLTPPQLRSDFVRPGRCLSASSFSEKANLAWDLEGRKSWLKIEVFVIGGGHRNRRILPNHLPACHKSSTLPLDTFGSVEFATDCLQATKGMGKMNLCTEKWPEFICCYKSSAYRHHWQSLLTALRWKSFRWFNQST